jgi:hypothetical protein
VEHLRDQRRTHYFILGAIVLLTALLRFCPDWVLLHSPGCVMKTYLHLSCPFCGMTRDFVAILHGNKPEFNRFSWMAIVVVYLVYPSLFFWARGTRRLSVFHQPATYRLVGAVLLLMFAVNNLPH